MFDFNFLIVLIACTLSATLTSALGCIGLWNGFVFFGDCLSHAALLGVSLSIISNTPFYFMNFIVAIAIGFIANKSSYKKDNIFALISYSCLAFSIILTSFFPNLSIKTDSLLFGDILSVNNQDIIMIAIVSFIINFIIYFYKKEFVLLSLDKNIAHTNNINIKKFNLLIFLLYAFAMSFGIKVFGALFMPALSVFISMCARKVSKNPFDMLNNALIIGTAVCCLGVFFSYHFDIAPVPLIIIVNLLLYLILKLYKG